MIGNYWLYWTGVTPCGGGWGIGPHEPWHRGEYGGYFVALPPGAGCSSRQWFAPVEDEV